MSTDTNLFAVFRANLLNKDENLAIIDANFGENCTIFDQKRSFVHYFDLVSQRLISACQICPKLVIAKTSKNGTFCRSVKTHPSVLPKLARPLDMCVVGIENCDMRN